MKDVVGQADTLAGINFASFDNDGPNGIAASVDNCNTPACLADGRIGDDDGYVDAVFILADGLGPNAFLWSGPLDYVTRDAGAHGQYIKVSGSRGVRAWGGEASQLFAYSPICHDWGHILGLLDYFGPENQVVPEQFNWRRLGTFSLTGNPHSIDNRQVPLDPYSQIRLGWVHPDSIITVDTPLYAQQIPNFVTSGKIYKIRKSPSEYFLVTNHKGVNPVFNDAGYHEGTFRGYGVLIWHIDTTATDLNDRSHKLFDLELAHGLWNFDPNTFAPTTPNPRYGKDSLDIWHRPGTTTYMGYPASTPAQSFNCFWNAANNNKIHFDGSSNPSSDGYRDSVIDYIRLQDIPTLIGVRNIQSPSEFTTATADLLANSWYGSIRQNTTWGPGIVSVIGDVTVDSGLTLTIQPGTTIKFRENYDNMQFGGSVKSQLIVKGTLTCLGNQTDSIIFTSSAVTPANGDWGGMLVAFPGRANVEFTRFSYADTAISVWGDTATVLVYNSTFTHFNSAAVCSRSAKTRLGGIVPIPVPPDCGKNNFLMNTATSGAKAVIKSTIPGGTLKAEGNWWSQAPPQSGWFVGNVDYNPYLLGYATPDSCIPFGQFSEPPPEGRIVAIGNVPAAFDLGQNYPNPFNPTTTIQYALPEPANVELKIFNMLGQVVRTLVEEEKGAGYHQIVWDGKDEAGRTVSTGIYLYQIKAGDFVETKKMQLVK
ncbi:MAG: T9SS type A sorting domain-containing protein [candidate division Zixibacteria bacterium]|nr:T9SS type A sorting domain-containing protein [candidate division Zixibacteria bacterium]